MAQPRPGNHQGKKLGMNELYQLGIYRCKKTFRWFSCWMDKETSRVITVNLDESGSFPIEHFEQLFERKSA